MQNMREELEDLAFAELDPQARESIVKRLGAARRAIRRSASRASPTRSSASSPKPASRPGSRAAPSGPFSIWRKLKDKKINFEQLSDVFGFRAVVGSEEDCYRALGVLHRTWRMIPERFKDFISLPKSNGYRSIHTTVMGPENQRVEVQLRTQEMHDVAERGVAAHWRYREACRRKRSERRVKAYEWLRDMVDLLERGDNPEEFYEHSKLNLYQDQVFCFTPKGMLIALPRGATPIDFAYFVHTDVGNTRGRRQGQRRPYAAAHAAEERRSGRDHLLQGADAVAAVGALRRHGPRARGNPPLSAPCPARPACRRSGARSWKRRSPMRATS